MLHVNKDYIDNPQGMIDILIGLESANLLLREVHYVAGIPVKKSFYSKDIMLGNSVLTNKMVIKSAIGGMTFGEANSIYYSDSQPANLYCEAQNSTFHVKNIPSIELMLRSANVSQTLAARITNPLRTVRMEIQKVKNVFDRSCRVSVQNHQNPLRCKCSSCGMVLTILKF